MRRMSCLWLLVFACGCAMDQSHNTGSLSPGESQGGDRFAQNILVLMPKDLLSGRRWDFENANSEQLQACLSRPLPILADTQKNQTIFDILEKVTGKTFVWVPALTEEDRIVLGRVSRYQDVLSALPHADRGTVKDALDFLLTGLSEFGPHGLVRTERIVDDNVINIAIITRSHIIIVALPDS